MADENRTKSAQSIGSESTASQREKYALMGREQVNRFAGKTAGILRVSVPYAAAENVIGGRIGG